MSESALAMLDRRYRRTHPNSEARLRKDVPSARAGTLAVMIAGIQVPSIDLRD
jgi:hypothetical protein